MNNPNFSKRNLMQGSALCRPNNCYILLFYSIYPKILSISLYVINIDKPINKAKSVKAYNEAVKNGYVKIREDYIHSFIDEHERDHEPEEEE